MKYYELTKEEQVMLEAIENGEFRPVQNQAEAKKRAIEAALNTLNKNKNINIRLTERDLQKIKAKSVGEGIPYQTLISSIIHKYVN